MKVEILRSLATWNEFEQHPDLVQLRFCAENEQDHKVLNNIRNQFEGSFYELHEVEDEETNQNWLCLTMEKGEKK